MTRRAPVQVFAKRWWLLLLCAVIGAGLALMYVSSRAKVYEATASIVATPGVKSQSDQYVLQRVPTYPLILSSNVLLTQVADQLGPGFTVSDVEGAVTATNPLNTAVVDLSVKSSTPERANKIAASIMDNGIRTLNGLEASRVVVSAIMTPDISRTSVVSAHRSLYLLLGLFAGLVIGGGSALLFERIRPDGSDVERTKEQAGKRQKQPADV